MIAKRKFATRHRSELRWRVQGKADLLPDKLPPIRLRHGQALWLLTELGYRGAVNSSTFYEYIKSLRKLGIPFGVEKFQTKRKRRLAEYSYCRIMELAVTLSLRVYHVVPDSVLRGVIQYRSRLDRLYRRAYAERNSGAGRPIIIETEGHEPIVLRGLFLDLNVKFSGGQLLRFGPPKLLSAAAVLQRFSQSAASARPLMPMRLSILSEEVISLALQASDIHTGSKARKVSRADGHQCQDHGEHRATLPIPGERSVTQR